jgi:hypothetical protein
MVRLILIPYPLAPVLSAKDPAVKAHFVQSNDQIVTEGSRSDGSIRSLTRVNGRRGLQ